VRKWFSKPNLWNPLGRFDGSRYITLYRRLRTSVSSWQAPLSHHFVRLYKIWFHDNAVSREFIILLLTLPQRGLGLTHTPYNIGDGNIV